jgi:hypothetical protein
MNQAKIFAHAITTLLLLPLNTNGVALDTIEVMARNIKGTKIERNVDLFVEFPDGSNLFFMEEAKD